MYKILKYIYKIYHYIQVFFLRLFIRTFSKSLDPSYFSRVLIISPHPDDEVFGCGGLMKSLIQMEKQVELVILSKGEAAHKHCCPDDEERVVRARAKLTDTANGILGVDSKYIHRLNFPDADFASVKSKPDMLMELGKLIKGIAPTEIFIPHPYENSPDHVAATEIIEDILTSITIPVYYYCVWTWYHMPMYKILKLKYKNARLLRVANREAKNKAIDVYINNQARCGVSYSGDLPKPFIYAFRWKYELFFKA